MTRVAFLSDIPSIARMALLFKENSPYSSLKVDKDKVNDTIFTVVNGDKDKTLVLVSENDEGECVGLLAAMISEHLWSYDKYAVELLWWIDPEYRTGRRAISLIDTYEKWAKDKGCNYIQVSSLESSFAPGLERLYKMRGFRKLEYSFLKDI